MIKDIFLPEKIHSFYLFSRQIVAFEVGNRTVHATVLRAHRSKRTIQKFLEEAYDPQDPEGLLNALKILVKRIGAYDDAYVALPSALAVFKNLELPFTVPEKIKLVLPFEVEPLLPFSLPEAAIDAVINETDTQRARSDVFVVAMRRATLDATLMPFITAGINLKKVTIGSIELYGLLRTTQFHHHTGTSFIIDLSREQTTIMLLAEGKLRAIRVIHEGITGDFVRNAHEHINVSDTATQRFFTTVQFTVQALLKTEQLHTPITGALLTGPGAQAPEMVPLMSELLEAPCTLFHPNKMLHNGDIVLDHEGSIPPEFTISLATALSSPFTEDFNLGRMYETTQELAQFRYQTFTAIALLICMFASFFAYSFFTARALRTEADASRSQVLSELKKAYPSLDIKATTALSTATNDAQGALTSETAIWFALSNERRYAFLYYLQELFTRINDNLRSKSDLSMKRLAIKSGDRSGEDTLIFEAVAQGYDALREVEEGLREAKTVGGADLFINLPPSLQNMKINLSLKINKDTKGAS